MSPNQYDVIIIGSGLAGITAAEALVRYNLKILILDENDQIGGQILKRSLDKQGPKVISGSNKIKLSGLKKISYLKESNIDIKKKTRVVGILSGPEILVEENQERLLRYTAKIILLATGGREKFMPFKGWTLPGVISTGALQLLLKRDNIIPSGKVLIAGSGLFLYAVAHDLLANNGRITMIADQGRFTDNFQVLQFMLEQREKIKDGIKFLSKIYRSKVRIQRTSRVVEALGEDRIEEAVIARIDSNGKIVKGSERKYSTELLAIGNGFIPNIEIAQSTGCELTYDNDMSGWFVKVNQELETTVEGIFAAGEITGVAGAHKSVTEGELAGLSIVKKLGLVSEDEVLIKIRKLQKDRVKHQNFGKFFNSLAMPKIGSEDIIGDDTIICRCEDIRFGDIRQAVTNGNISAESIKKATGLGMGNCQGRTCGPIIYDILTSFFQTSAENLQPLSVRVPTKPVNLSHLAQLKKITTNTSI